MTTLTGTIVKGIGGFYYVEAADGIYECRARGVFRNDGVTPLVGDRVSITVNDGDTENTIDEIFERKNELRRPPVANIDRVIIVVASKEPRPNPLVIDRLTAIAVRKGIEPVIVLNKADLKDVSELKETYEKTPFPVVITNGLTGEGTVFLCLASVILSVLVSQSMSVCCVQHSFIIACPSYSDGYFM